MPTPDTATSGSASVRPSRRRNFLCAALVSAVRTIPPGDRQPPDLQRTVVDAGPIVYSVIVFSAVLDWVVWDHPPTVPVLLGMALVIGGGLVAILLRPRTTAAAGTEVASPTVGPASGAPAGRAEE